MPVGGGKRSCLGRFGAHGVIGDFTIEHMISIQHSRRAWGAGRELRR